MAHRANREYLARLQGFLTIILIAFAITVVCLVDETESARETSKGAAKSSKSTKEKETKCKVLQDEDKNYFVQCGSGGEKGKTKNRKGSGENRKRPTSQCSSDCRGKRGSRGARGKSGSKGQPGTKGPRGPPGEDGRDGRNGFQGPKGPIGTIGKPGLKGSAGLRGTTGLKGEQGPRGPTGSSGPPGLPGSCVTQSSSSNTTAPTVYCLPGKQGLQGTKGETGRRGAPGGPGPRGNKGSRGHKGNVGPPGIKGEVGPPGDFAGLVCLPRYTSWINRSDWFSDYPEVHCDRMEFLQGFSLEESNARGQRRYKYTCCALRLNVSP